MKGNVNVNYECHGFSHHMCREICMYTNMNMYA